MNVNEDKYSSIANLGGISDKSFSFDVHIQSCVNKANKIQQPLQSPSLTSFRVWECNMIFLFEKADSHNWKSTEKSHQVEKDLKTKGFEIHRETAKVLKYKRFRSDLIRVYKIINRIDDLKLGKCFAPTKSGITRNAEHQFYVEYSKTNVRKFT